MAVGIRPNTTLGAESGIPVNRGIIVNDYMQTEIPHIYAVGECAEHRGIAYGLWRRCMNRQKCWQSICAASKQNRMRLRSLHTVKGIRRRGLLCR